MTRWHISNRKVPKGQLADVRRLIRGPERPSARSVIVPIESDQQGAAGVAGGLAGDQIRSFEMWWDAAESKLRFVMIADERDADNFERAFQVMYPNAAFDGMRETVPSWFDRGSAYRVFDVGTRHGHYATVFDEPGGEHSLITRMASAIQSASHAWIQFVFVRFDCTPFLRTHMTRLDGRFMEINRGNYTSWGDEITGRKPRKHPESIDYNKLETFGDVMDSHGIIILYDRVHDDFDIEKWRTDVLQERPHTQSVEVNGFDAVGVDGDPENGRISKLIFYDDRTQIQLISAAYTLSDLTKVASAL